MTNKAMRTMNDIENFMTKKFIVKLSTKNFIGKEDVTTAASKWSLVVKEREGKADILPSQQLLLVELLPMFLMPRPEIR